MSDQFKFRRVNEITGVAVLIVVGLIIAAIVWTARSQRWFKSSVTLRIILPEAGAAGIRQGSEVYFLGTLVGSVSDVLVDSKGRMEAHARLRRDFFLFVRSDSSAVVKKKFGVAGDAFFEITRGVGEPLPEENASIICNEQFQSSLEAAIEEIRAEMALVLKKASAGIESWALLGADLRGTQQKLDQVVRRWDAVMAGVEQGKGTVGALLNDSALADESVRLLGDARKAIAQSEGVLTNLSLAAQDVRQGAARLPEISETLAKEAANLPALMLQSRTSMEEMERVLVAMQNHWLLRRYVERTNSAPEPAKPDRLRRITPGRRPESQTR